MRRSGGEEGAAWQRVAGIALIVALAALAIVRSSIGTQLDGFTVDEPWHIVAGASYVRTGDFRLNPEHPPLIKLWAGAAMPDSFHLRALAALSEKSQERDFVEETMYFDNDAAAAQTRARLAMWSFHGILLVALGLLIWRACGLAWAVGTLMFIALEPSIGAHLPVVMTDLPLALTLAVAAICAGIFLADSRWRWVAALGVALGLALGSKHSALAGVAGIAGVLLASIVVEAVKRGPRAAAARTGKVFATGALALATLWALYGFHFHTSADGIDAFNRTMADKTADLQIPSWRAGVAIADRWELVPRAYLWGLADTIRAGVEGRGQNEHTVWGTRYIGRPPWFTWPSIVAGKVPLALLALALLGCVLVVRSKLPDGARWTLIVVLAMSAAHLLALMSAQGTYGGIRHALPLVLALAIVAGAVTDEAWRRRSRALAATFAGLVIAAAVMTLREPRLWEYHNELAGGSEGAYRYFSNEGVDLGQRFGEIRSFFNATIAPTGLPLYSDYWFSEKQARADRVNYHRRVESLDDSNVDGIYEGYFVYQMRDLIPRPEWDWDPTVVFKDMTMVARFGNAAIWRGRQVRPKTRAGSMYWQVIEYIYKNQGEDWSKVALRTAEILVISPQHLGAAIERANALVRLHDPASAAVTYRDLLAQQKMPLDDLTKASIENELKLLDAATATSEIPLLRNPWME